MALTVPLPAASFTEFSWLFHNNQQDSYQEDDIMDFSDSSAEYQSAQHQQQSNSRGYYMGDNNQTYNMQNGSKFCVDLESPSDSREGWTADYVKTMLQQSSSSSSSHNDGSRKRKNDWSQGHHGDFSVHLVDNGPMTKISSNSKDRRKSQGRLQWPDDIDLDLSAELMNGTQYSNDSLLNFPNLTVFKQEVPSPPNNGQQTPRSPNAPTSCVRVTQQIPTNGMDTSTAGNAEQNVNGSTSSSNGLANFLDQLDGNQGNGNSGSSNGRDSHVQSDDESRRFQYVLAAATSIATKSNEETLTYLNQGQSYEIKLKKLGDLSSCRGKVMKSVIKICFHERRLQYMEREQIQIWQSSRPGERILDIDIPLSYGLIQVNQAGMLNTAEILWDPMKEVGVYIKVNCISTEFTPKKHGGEKGVPFRIQIETYLEVAGEVATKPLHAAACQIKVFKLKGADRKHKQDRERIQKRPPNEQDKYQRSYDCTILNDICSDSLVTSTIGNYSPEHIKRNISPVLPTSPIHVPSNLTQMMPFPNPITIGNVSSTNGNLVVSTQSYDSDDHSPIVITKDSSPNQLTQWLAFHRLTGHAATFSHFSGCDLLRMSKDDLIQICGLADGIRMFNILHIKAIAPRLTIYVELDINTYHAIYLHSATTKELIQKLYKIPGIMDRATSSTMWKFSASPSQMNGSNPNLNDDSNFKIFVHGPNNVLVLVTDEVLANVKDESLFALEVNSANGSILMKAVSAKNKTGAD